MALELRWGYFSQILNGNGATHNHIRYKVGPTLLLKGYEQVQRRTRQYRQKAQVLKVYFTENKKICCESLNLIRFFGSGHSFDSGLRDKWDEVSLIWCVVITDFGPDFLVSIFLPENLDLNNRGGSSTFFRIKVYYGINKDFTKSAKEIISFTGDPKQYKIIKPWG